MHTLAMVHGVPVDCSAVCAGMRVVVSRRGVVLTTVVKGTASVAGGTQLTPLMPSTQENASGHGFDRQSS